MTDTATATTTATDSAEKHSVPEPAASHTCATDYQSRDTAITIRPIQKDDAHNGILETLDALRPASGIDAVMAESIISDIISDQSRLVAVAFDHDNNTIVGTASIHFEKKIIHNGGIAGHIEDVAVREGYQGAGIGTRIVKYLLDEARKRGCYKTILDCTDELVKYYECIGFERKSNGMDYRYNDTTS